MQKRIIFTSCLRMFWPSCTKYQQCCDCASEGFLWTPYIWVLTSNQKRKQFLVNVSTATKCLSTAYRQETLLRLLLGALVPTHPILTKVRMRKKDGNKTRGVNDYWLLDLHILMQTEKWYLKSLRVEKLRAGPCCSSKYASH